MPLQSVWEQFKIEFMIILTDGGLLMLPLTLLALSIYWIAFRLLFYYSEHGFYKIRRDDLIHAVSNPTSASSELRDIINYTQDAEVQSAADAKARFTEVHSSYLSDADTMRTYLLTLITTAPLLGLLGTVMGMLTTFSGLAISTGGSTVDQIASGISEALITTQTGLIIAIPAYVIATFILKRRNQMEACLTTMEALTVQAFQKNANNGISK